MSEPRIAHNIHVPTYNLGNTYCSVCGVWLYAGRPKEDHVILADLLSLGDSLAEAARRAHRKLNAYVGVCKGDKELTNTIIPMITEALSAWDAARKR